MMERQERRLLLRPSTVGPRRRATDERDELPPLHRFPRAEALFYLVG